LIDHGADHVVARISQPLTQVLGVHAASAMKQVARAACTAGWLRGYFYAARL